MANPKSTKPAAEKTAAPPAATNTASTAAPADAGGVTTTAVETSTSAADTTTSSDAAENTGTDRALTSLDAADLVGIGPSEVFHFVDLGDRVGVVTIDGRKLYADK